MGMPRHPDEEDDLPERSTPRRRVTLIIVLVALVLATVVVLHLTGVLGPGAHGR